MLIFPLFQIEYWTTGSLLPLLSPTVWLQPPFCSVKRPRPLTSEFEQSATWFAHFLKGFVFWFYICPSFHLFGGEKNTGIYVTSMWVTFHSLTAALFLAESRQSITFTGDSPSHMESAPPCDQLHSRSSDTQRLLLWLPGAGVLLNVSSCELRTMKPTVAAWTVKWAIQFKSV